MEPSALGLTPLVDSWLLKQPETFKKEHIDMLRQLLSDYAAPMIKIARKKVREISATVDNNLLGSHFRLLDCYFHKYIPTEANVVSADAITKLLSHITPIFLFTLVWSVGAACDN